MSDKANAVPAMATAAAASAVTHHHALDRPAAAGDVVGVRGGAAGGYASFGGASAGGMMPFELLLKGKAQHLQYIKALGGTVSLLLEMKQSVRTKLTTSNNCHTSCDR